MTSSISWIDRDGLATTLARMGATEPRTRLGRRGTRRASFLSAGTEPSPAPPATPAPPAIEPYEVHGATLRDRLEGFVDWLIRQSRGRAAFIIDEDGLPLIDRQADSDLLTIASSVMQLLSTINAKLFFPLGNLVSLELERDQLSLITVKTPIGQYIVGLVSASPAPAPLRSRVDQAFQSVFRYDGEPEQAELPS